MERLYSIKEFIYYNFQFKNTGTFLNSVFEPDTGVENIIVEVSHLGRKTKHNLHMMILLESNEQIKKDVTKSLISFCTALQNDLYEAQKKKGKYLVRIEKSDDGKAVDIQEVNGRMLYSIKYDIINVEKRNKHDSKSWSFF